MDFNIAVRVRVLCVFDLFFDRFFLDNQKARPGLYTSRSFRLNLYFACLVLPVPDVGPSRWYHPHVFYPAIAVSVPYLITQIFSGGDIYWRYVEVLVVLIRAYRLSTLINQDEHARRESTLAPDRSLTFV